MTDFFKRLGRRWIQRLALLAALLGAPGAALCFEAPDAETDRLMREGLGLLLANDYAAAERLFQAGMQRKPEEALPMVGLLFLYQLDMYERDSFSREKDFDRLADEALRTADRSLGRRGLAWDHTMAAAVHGMRGLLEARRTNWLGAARLGLKAKEALQQAQKLEPGLADAYLGLGVYHYYASVVTKNYWFLPGFGDKRAQGLREVHRAREEGVYLGALADFALLYIYYDEKRFEEAHELASRLVRRYPRNLLARSWVGWMQMKLGRYAAASETFRQVNAEAPGRLRSLYYLACSQLYAGGDLNGAVANFQAFLGSEPSSYWRARAYYRMGTAHQRLGSDEAAVRAFQASAYIDPKYRQPRERLERLEARRKGTASPLPRKGEVRIPLARSSD